MRVSKGGREDTKRTRRPGLTVRKARPMVSSLRPQPRPAWGTGHHVLHGASLGSHPSTPTPSRLKAGSAPLLRLITGKVGWKGLLNRRVRLPGSRGDGRPHPQKHWASSDRENLQVGDPGGRRLAEAGAGDRTPGSPPPRGCLCGCCVTREGSRQTEYGFVPARELRDL